MGRLTTHVLDLVAGRPAAGVPITLDRLDAGGARTRVASTVTNEDGRAPEPLLSDTELTSGRYELVFSIGSYFEGAGFLDEVPIRFRIDDPEQHYHVPLLASPWSYSTYRGS